MWLEELHIDKKIIPQYELIINDKKPIFIWGCGALATRVYEYCRKYNIKVEGVFVDVDSDNEIFLGLKVFRLDELIKYYDKFSVIIGHSNYFDGIQELKTIKNVENIYCLSSVCCDVTNLITTDFLQDNRIVLDEFYNDLMDDKSRLCLSAYLQSRINDVAEYIFPHFDKDTNYYINDVFSLQEEEVLLDVGACVGAAIWSFIAAVRGKYKWIIALEPDETNYLRLKNDIESRKIKNIFLKQMCAYNENENVRFEGNLEGGKIRNTGSGYSLYPAIKIDSLCEEIGNEAENISIIKINLLDPVPEILEGAQKLLKKKKPKLIIRAGYDENVLLKIWMSVKALNPEYRIYLRYTLGIPQGLTIFAI